jgi:hypothetical protein
MNQVLRMLLLVIMNSFQHKKVACCFSFFSNRDIFPRVSVWMEETNPIVAFLIFS